jgi:hypothetical protein
MLHEPDSGVDPWNSVRAAQPGPEADDADDLPGRHAHQRIAHQSRAGIAYATVLA